MHAEHIEQSSNSQLSAWEHLEGYRVGQQILNEVCQADGADDLSIRLLTVYQLYVSILSQADLD